MRAPRESKVVDSIAQALKGCGAKSGMTFSFHHLRDRDYVVNMVMQAAIEELGLDELTIAAPTSDCVGNCRGAGGKSNCGSMGYAITDAKYADHVVVITDCLVDFPNFPASVEAIDVQDFNLDAVQSIHTTPGHYEMSAGRYANPANKGTFVNKLDFVVLAALEIDTGFNVNVLTGSDGVLRGAPGGHPDTVAGSKVCVIVTPLVRGRMATVCEHVVTVTTPGTAWTCWSPIAASLSTPCVPT